MEDLGAGGGDLPPDRLGQLAALCLNDGNTTASDFGDLAPLLVLATPRSLEQVEQDERFAAAALGGSSTFFADFTDLAQNLLRSTKGLVIEAASRVGAALGIDAAVRRPHPVCPRLGVGRLCCCRSNALCIGWSPTRTHPCGLTLPAHRQHSSCTAVCLCADIEHIHLYRYPENLFRADGAMDASRTAVLAAAAVQLGTSVRGP